jgi:hypothetical protein
MLSCLCVAQSQNSASTATQKRPTKLRAMLRALVSLTYMHVFVTRSVARRRLRVFIQRTPPLPHFLAPRSHCVGSRTVRRTFGVSIGRSPSVLRRHSWQSLRDNDRLDAARCANVLLICREGGSRTRKSHRRAPFDISRRRIKTADQSLRCDSRRRHRPAVGAAHPRPPHRHQTPRPPRRPRHCPSRHPCRSAS